MKMLSLHPFSLYANGGGSRILRRLYEGREADVTSLVVEASGTGPAKGLIKEVVVFAGPTIKPWARWKLRNLLTWLRVGIFKRYTIGKIRQAALKADYDVLHVVNHYTFSAALCDEKFIKGKQLWASFHDHYNEIKSPVDDTRALWERADRRLVISDELGQKYQQEFGNKQYEIITDGVKDEEMNLSEKPVGDPITIYFAGLLHITYLPLFKALADALDILTKQGQSFKLVLRGTQNLDFLQSRSFITEYRPMTLNNAELKNELDVADILYLPIKFTNPYFYLYSLSTKMVGYLAAPGVILYHGPGDSAACSLLIKADAAVTCISINVDELLGDIEHALRDSHGLSANAKQLAQKRFKLADIQKRFWQGA